ncbi:MAG: hypothetical protein LBV50_05900 [Novosphingobium sp.]|jgi:hypothetical protein|nr:hypothetical protein [Novosphingobium sp.]
MMGFLPFFVAVVLVTAICCLVADRWWPAASRNRLALICGLAVPSGVLALYPIVLIWVFSPVDGSGGISDAGAMAFLGIGVIFGVAALSSLLVGFPVAHLVLWYLRKNT